ncbi:MAG TPA: molybdopterin molybdenumtransferase MoeA, partial [Azospirillaceae bacterium]|nr:molybdopterin molybdenumtransferase MoeA [Azospirillaceae bacterium]
MGCCDIADPADPFAPLPLDAALARLGGDYACVVETESVALKAAAGRILAEDVAAPFDAPPSPVSAMDGYGFVHPGPTGAEGQTTFRIIGRVPAGSMFDGVVGPGEAVRIFTGAPVPAGVDTVVMQEDCCADGDAVTVRVTPKPGAN